MSNNNMGYFVNEYETSIPEAFNFVNNPFMSALSRVNEFISLNANWDGYNSVPVATQSGQNAINFVTCLNDVLLEKVSDIFPNPHGTITFEWVNSSEEKISLEIGSNSYSYFVTHSNKTPKLIDGKDIFSNIGEITNEISSLVRE
ncbi:MAG: hypothetical protein ABIO79_02340 [Ferruginibacter sp.]